MPRRSRRISWLPLDAATHGGVLNVDGGPAFKDGIYGGGELASVRIISFRTRLVEAAAVGQFVIGVVHVDVGRADRAVRASDFLRGVVQVGEGEADVLRMPGHFLRRVVGVSLGIVRADRDELDADRKSVV